MHDQYQEKCACGIPGQTGFSCFVCMCTCFVPVNQNGCFNYNSVKPKWASTDKYMNSGVAWWTYNFPYSLFYHDILN